MSKTKTAETENIQPEIVFNRFRRAEDSNDYRGAAEALEELERLGYRITRVKAK